MTIQTSLASISSLEIMMMLRGFIPVVIIVAIGVIIGRWDNSRHHQTLDTLIHYVFLPCLVFSSIHRHHPDLKEILLIGSAAVLLVAALTAAALLMTPKGAGSSATNRLGIVYMSSGTLLLPLAYILFGNQGLAKAIYFHLFILLLFHTLGSCLSEGRTTLGTLFKTPLLYVMALGILVAASPAEPPENLQEFAWLAEKGVDITGMGALPLLLISFGYPLGLLKLSDARKGLAGGVLRIIGGPLLAFLLIYIYRSAGWLVMERGYDILGYIDQRTTEAVIVIGAAMPASHYALKLDQNAESCASGADAGTLLVSVTGGIFTVCATLFLTRILIFTH